MGDRKERGKGVFGWLRRLAGPRARPEAEGPADPPAPAGPDLHELIEGVREFHETLAREVMIPRTEIKAVDERDSQDEAVDLILATGLSRLPVYRGSIDHVVGIVHAKDLLRCYKEGTRDKPLADLLREPYFIPLTKKVDHLLADFRERRAQIAIVLDEYGGTAGLVTLEDLIEEIVGDIEDEHDFGAAKLTEVSPEEILVSGRVEIGDVEDFFGVEIASRGVTTVAGWIAEITGHIPTAGEEIEAGGFRLTVEAADERRIGRVRIRRPPPPEGTQDPETHD